MPGHFSWAEAAIAAQVEFRVTSDITVSYQGVLFVCDSWKNHSESGPVSVSWPAWLNKIIFEILASHRIFFKQPIFLSQCSGTYFCKELWFVKSVPYLLWHCLRRHKWIPWWTKQLFKISHANENHALSLTSFSFSFCLCAIVTSHHRWLILSAMSASTVMSR